MTGNGQERGPRPSFINFSSFGEGHDLAASCFIISRPCSDTLSMRKIRFDPLTLNACCRDAVGIGGSTKPRWITRCDIVEKGKAKPGVLPSSGNVFVDLGLPNAQEKRTKVRLAVAINQLIQGQKLSQTTAARRLNVNQPKVSALSNHQLDGSSVERLMTFLTALDRDVDIVIRRTPRSRKGGRILVSAA